MTQFNATTIVTLATTSTMRAPFTDHPSMSPSVIFPAHIYQVTTTVLNLLGITFTAFALGRRTTFEQLSSIQGWLKLSWPRLCVILVFASSWSFIFTSGVLINGTGLSLNVASCSMGIYSCICIYAITKMFIYSFLAEKVFIVWTPRVSGASQPARWSSHMYRLSMICIAPLGVILIIAILNKVAEIRDPDGACVIGLKRVASLSLLCFDLFITLVLTGLFVYPLRRKEIISPKLRRVASRTLLASCVALMTSVINITVLTTMHGRQLGWICLTSCGADVTVNSMVLFWVTGNTLSSPSKKLPLQKGGDTRSLNVRQSTSLNELDPDVMFGNKNDGPWSAGPGSDLDGASSMRRPSLPLAGSALPARFIAGAGGGGGQYMVGGRGGRDGLDYDFDEGEEDEIREKYRQSMVRGDRTPTRFAELDPEKGQLSGPNVKTLAFASPSVGSEPGQQARSTITIPSLFHASNAPSSYPPPLAPFASAAFYSPGAATSNRGNGTDSFVAPASDYRFPSTNNDQDDSVPTPQYADGSEVGRTSSESSSGKACSCTFDVPDVEMGPTPTPKKENEATAGLKGRLRRLWSSATTPTRSETSPSPKGPSRFGSRVEISASNPNMVAVDNLSPTTAAGQRPVRKESDATAVDAAISSRTKTSPRTPPARMNDTDADNQDRAPGLTITIPPRSLNDDRISVGTSSSAEISPIRFRDRPPTVDGHGSSDPELHGESISDTTSQHCDTTTHFPPDLEPVSETQTRRIADRGGCPPGHDPPLV